MQKISVVVPCYRSGKWLDELVFGISESLEDFSEDWEIILIDDASPDGGSTFREIQRLSKKFSVVRGVRLQFNVGQFRALMCGLSMSEGDIIVTIDDDLQHPPEEIPKLIKYLNENSEIDCVIGKYKSKRHGPIRNLGSKLIGSLLSTISDRPKDIVTTSFRAFRKPVKDSIISHKTVRPVMASIVLKSTKKIANVEVRHSERPYGKSGWKFGQMFLATKDLVFNSTTWPLRSFIYIGTITAILSFLTGGYMLIRYLGGTISEPGYTSIMLSMLFLGGIQLAGLGMMGEYIDRIISEVQSPPRWVVAETTSDAGGVSNDA